MDQNDENPKKLPEVVKSDLPANPESRSVTDLTHWDETVLGKFKDDGLPGISKITPDQMTQMFELYMQGRTYNQISQIVNVKKGIVLYFSEKSQWYAQKQAYLTDMSNHLSGKISAAKMESVDFLADTFYFFQQYYKSKMDNYAKTKDDRIVESMSSKFLPYMFKAAESLQKIGDENSKNAAAVNINVGAGANISSDGKTMNINTADQNNLEQIFTMLAKMKRDEQVKRAEDEVAIKREKSDEKSKRIILKKKQKK